MLTGKRRLLSYLAIASGVLASGCSSSSDGSEADAMADAPADRGKDASSDRAERGADATPDAREHDAHVDAKAKDGAGGEHDGSDRDSSRGDASIDDASKDDGGSDASDSASTADGADGDASSSDASDGGRGAELLIPGASLSIGGSTGDDYIVYYDSSTQTYYARPFAGGPATTIYAAPSSAYSGYLSVIGNVAFVWSWNSNYVGTLVAWSSGMTQGNALTSNGLAYLYQTMWASDDSKHIAYVATTSSDASVSSIYGANADGTGVTLLVSDIDTNASFSGQAPACFPRLVFRGDYAVLSYCTVSDAGLTPEIQSFSVTNGWASAAVIPNWVDSLQYNPLDRSPFTFPFIVDPDGGQIAVAASSSGNGAIQVFPIAGGGDGGTVVDPSAVVTPSLSFTGSVNTPWSILYNDATGALKQAFATNPTPQTLVDGGVNYFNALSDDGHWMLVSNTTNASGWFADLSLVSTQTPGTPVLIASSAEYDGGGVAPRPISSGGKRGFTTDSAYALAVTNLVETNTERWLGSLRSTPVAPPYTAKLLTNGYMVDYVTVSGSKILVDDNYQQTAGTVDIDEVDPASSGGAVSIASGVPGDYAVSSDRTQIAYTVATGTAPGIYVTAVP